jgi:N utilization substance protein B
MRPRTAGRRLALQYLFMADMNNYRGVETPSEFFKTQRHAILDNSAAEAEGGFVFDEDNPRRDEAEDFASGLIREVGDRHDAIDREIEEAAVNWSIARMGVIERNVLRLVVAEMGRGDTPRSVVLDEAVELAKRFGDKESGAFVNGIADKFGREK